MGEIKSTTKEIIHAAQQLKIRLAFLAWAFYAVTKDSSKKPGLKLRGRIFIPTLKNPPSLEEIATPGLPPCVQESDITLVYELL